jgi:uncharacterized Zn finger protein
VKPARERSRKSSCEARESLPFTAESSQEATLVHRVMDAAMSQRPDWVIENARHRAEEIMNRGKADAYHHAVEWLGKVKAGYQVSGRNAEWLAYYQDLVQTHGRKYKLMGLLQKL